MLRLSYACWTRDINMNTASWFIGILLLFVSYRRRRRAFKPTHVFSPSTLSKVTKLNAVKGQAYTQRHIRATLRRRQHLILYSVEGTATGK